MSYYIISYHIIFFIFLFLFLFLFLLWFTFQNIPYCIILHYSTFLIIQVCRQWSWPKFPPPCVPLHSPPSFLFTPSIKFISIYNSISISISICIYSHHQVLVLVKIFHIILYYSTFSIIQDCGPWCWRLWEWMGIRTYICWSWWGTFVRTVFFIFFIWFS